MAHFGTKSSLRSRISQKCLEIRLFGPLRGLTAVKGEVDGLNGRTVRLHHNLDFDLRFAKV